MDLMGIEMDQKDEEIATLKAERDELKGSNHRLLELRREDAERDRRLVAERYKLKREITTLNNQIDILKEQIAKVTMRCEHDYEHWSSHEEQNIVMKQEITNLKAERDEWEECVSKQRADYLYQEGEIEGLWTVLCDAEEALLKANRILRDLPAAARETQKTKVQDTHGRPYPLE